MTVIFPGTEIFPGVMQTITLILNNLTDTAELVREEEKKNVPSF